MAKIQTLKNEIGKLQLTLKERNEQIASGNRRISELEKKLQEAAEKAEAAKAA